MLALICGVIPYRDILDRSKGAAGHKPVLHKHIFGEVDFI